MEVLDAYNGVNQQGVEATSLSGPSAFKQVDLGAIDLDLLLGLLNSSESFLLLTAHS